MADIYTFLLGLLFNPVWLVIFAAFMIIIALVLGTVFMTVGLGVADGKHKEFGTVFVTVLIGAILGWIPCLGCIIYWYIIKTRHETSWGGAIIAWIIAGLIPLAIAFAAFFFILLPFL